MTTAAPIDRRALGRRLTRLANATVGEVLAMTRDAEAEADAGVPRIGITGPPGAGKSSLGGRLALLRARTQRKRVGVMAIDPSSPRTGGAILGDRIRMDDLEGAGELYMRSLASRSAADGLADNLPELLHAMECAGFDELLLETVGVGQAEHAARSQVDTLVLVLIPGSGDTIQAMKAGIMELADIYVINKSDLPGAQQMAADIRRTIGLARMESTGWRPDVLMTSTQDAESIARLSAEIDRHQAWLAQAGSADDRRRERARYRLRSLLERRVAEVTSSLADPYFDQPFARQVERLLEMLVPPQA
jgi:LAO/AO transport system kinase